MGKIESWQETYVNGIDISKFEIIKEISSDHRRYHIGFKRKGYIRTDLLFSEVDENYGITQWYIVDVFKDFTPIGYSNEIYEFIKDENIYT